MLTLKLNTTHSQLLEMNENVMTVKLTSHDIILETIMNNHDFDKEV